MLELQPITFQEAKEYVRRYHRHHLPPIGYIFCLAVNDNKKVVGVLIAGRPVARHFDDSWTIEVTRCCTDDSHNAGSKLYSAAARAARALGYRRIITYTLLEESGISLKAAGWRTVWKTKGGSWSRRKRIRIDKHPLDQKLLWEAPTEAKRAG